MASYSNLEHYVNQPISSYPSHRARPRSQQQHLIPLKHFTQGGRLLLLLLVQMMLMMLLLLLLKEGLHTGKGFAGSSHCLGHGQRLLKLVVLVLLLLLPLLVVLVVLVLVLLMIGMIQRVLIVGVHPAAV